MPLTSTVPTLKVSQRTWSQASSITCSLGKYCPQLHNQEGSHTDRSESKASPMGSCSSPWQHDTPVVWPELQVVVLKMGKTILCDLRWQMDKALPEPSSSATEEDPSFEFLHPTNIFSLGFRLAVLSVFWKLLVSVLKCFTVNLQTINVIIQ